MNITDRISFLEILWVTVSIIGLTYTLLLLQRAFQDYCWLLETADANGDRPIRKKVAVNTILIFMGGVFQQLVYLTTGIIAMTQTNQLSPANIAFRAVIVLGSIVASVLAGVIYKRRSEVIMEVIEKLKERDSSE